MSLSYFNYQHDTTFGGRRKPFSDSAEFSLTHCHVCWLYGRHQLLAPHSSSVWGSVQPGTQPVFFFFFFYQFRGIICLHEGNDMSLVLLPVLSIGFTCGQVISSFPICQNSGKPRNLWIELPLLCKAPAPDER